MSSAMTQLARQTAAATTNSRIIPGDFGEKCEAEEAVNPSSRKAASFIQLKSSPNGKILFAFISILLIDQDTSTSDASMIGVASGDWG